MNRLVNFSLKSLGTSHLDLVFRIFAFLHSSSGSWRALSSSADTALLRKSFQRIEELVWGGFHRLSHRAMRAQRIVILVCGRVDVLLMEVRVSISDEILVLEV